MVLRFKWQLYYHPSFITVYVNIDKGSFSLKAEALQISMITVHICMVHDVLTPSRISIAHSIKCTKGCVWMLHVCDTQLSQPSFVMSRSTPMKCSRLLTDDEWSFPKMLTEQDSRCGNMWEKPYYNVTLLRYLTKQTALLYLFIYLFCLYLNASNEKTICHEWNIIPSLHIEAFNYFL